MPIQDGGSCAPPRYGNVKGKRRRHPCSPPTLLTHPRPCTFLIYRLTHNATKNAPASPLVPSCTAIASSCPYLRLNSPFTRSICTRSQCSRTSREINRSVFGFDVAVADWLDLGFGRQLWMSIASRTGRFSAPLRTCVRVSPWSRRVNNGKEGKGKKECDNSRQDCCSSPT